MQKKIRCTFAMEIDVDFENPEAAIKYFIDGEWKTVFYKLDDLNGVAECLSRSFHQEDDSWDGKNCCFYRSMEGFGRFIRQDSPNTDTFKSDDATAKEIGSHIIIKYEQELDHDVTYEV